MGGYGHCIKKWLCLLHDAGVLYSMITETKKCEKRVYLLYRTGANDSKLVK